MPAAAVNIALPAGPPSPVGKRSAGEFRGSRTGPLGTGGAPENFCERWQNEIKTAGSGVSSNGPKTQGSEKGAAQRTIGEGTVAGQRAASGQQRREVRAAEGAEADAPPERIASPADFSARDRKRSSLRSGPAESSPRKPKARPPAGESALTVLVPGIAAPATIAPAVGPVPQKANAPALSPNALSNALTAAETVAAGAAAKLRAGLTGPRTDGPAARPFSAAPSRHPGSPSIAPVAGHVLSPGAEEVPGLQQPRAQAPRNLAQSLSGNAQPLSADPPPRLAMEDTAARVLPLVSGAYVEKTRQPGAIPAQAAPGSGPAAASAVPDSKTIAAAVPEPRTEAPSALASAGKQPPRLRSLAPGEHGAGATGQQEVAQGVAVGPASANALGAQHAVTGPQSGAGAPQVESGRDGAARGEQDPFAALDTASATSAPAWIHAGAQRAEAGFNDPALGWVGVRASLTGGAVHATVLPGSAEASQALSGHLAGLNAHLAEHRIGLDSLSVAPPARPGPGAGMGSFAQGNAPQQQGQGSEQQATAGDPREAFRVSALRSAGIPAATSGNEARDSVQMQLVRDRAGTGTRISVIA